MPLHLVPFEFLKSNFCFLTFLMVNIYLNLTHQKLMESRLWGMYHGSGYIWVIRPYHPPRRPWFLDLSQLPRWTVRSAPGGAIRHDSNEKIGQTASSDTFCFNKCVRTGSVEGPFVSKVVLLATFTRVLALWQHRPHLGIKLHESVFYLASWADNLYWAAHSKEALAEMCVDITCDL